MSSDSVLSVAKTIKATRNSPTSNLLFPFVQKQKEDSHARTRKALKLYLYRYLSKLYLRATTFLVFITEVIESIAREK